MINAGLRNVTLSAAKNRGLFEFRRFSLCRYTLLSPSCRMVFCRESSGIAMSGYEAVVGADGLEFGLGEVAADTAMMFFQARWAAVCIFKENESKVGIQIMQKTVVDIQNETCRRFGVSPLACQMSLKVGISRNVKDGATPINGVRVRPEGDTTGWYIWAGEYSDAADFYLPLHAEHLVEWCPQVIPYLGLPTGWRFLLASNYEDVWYDADIFRAEEGR